MKKGLCAYPKEMNFQDPVFERAANVFRVLSAPMRLQIISHLCDGEKSVRHLRGNINTTQPTLSQHLSTLYRAGVLGRRREGVQIHYRIIDPRVAQACRAVCMHIAADSQ